MTWLLLLNTRHAQNLSRTQIQVAGVTVDRVRGQGQAVLVELHARVKGVGVWFFGVPEDISILSNAIQVGFTARVTRIMFQHNGSIRGLDGLLNFRVKRLDVHVHLTKASSACRTMSAI